MKAKKIVFQISVENQRREFDTKLLLACGTPPEALSYHKLDDNNLAEKVLRKWVRPRSRLHLANPWKSGQSKHHCKNLSQDHKILRKLEDRFLL